MPLLEFPSCLSANERNSIHKALWPCSWVKDQRCGELQCKSKMHLGSQVNVAVAQAGSYSSD